MSVIAPASAEAGHALKEGALRQLDNAARALNLDPGMHRFLRVPERTLIVSVPVMLEEGKLEVYTGYRVQHSTARGPGEGGIASIPASRSKRSRASRCS